MANFFTNLFKKQSPSVIGLDIGTSSIKLVQLSRKSGRAVLETYGELSLGPYAHGSIGEATNLPLNKVVEAINDLLVEKEVNITTRICGIAIPFSSSLVSVIDFPMVSAKELANMVPLEARKYVPVPMSEVTIDWSLIPQDKNPESNPNQKFGPDGKPLPPRLEVLVVALHNGTIEKYKKIATQSGLQTDFFEIEIFSTMRSVLDQEITPMMLLDMGAMTTKIYIVEKGILRASHTINKGSYAVTSALAKSLGISFTEAEVLKREKGLTNITDNIGVKDIMTVTIDYIFSEANRVIIAYEKKYNKNVSKVVMVGGGSALIGLTEIAKKSFQTEVVSGDPFSKVITPAFLEDVLKRTGPQFAVAVGLALRKLQEVE
ncbi:MAG: type IV pilus assembly protein PilM [Candidatus Paceibacterota bacterium]